jgi:hypothetical protein
MSGITLGSEAWWGAPVEPGNQITLRLISPFPPTDRQFVVEPSWGHSYWRYDYSEVEDDQEDIPWIDDFTITGMTHGPACTNTTEPPDPEYGAFAGSQKSSESDIQNGLLTYSSPLRDRFMVPTGTPSIDFIIHYAPNIAPETFDADVTSLSSDEANSLFRPVPGTRETVSIPIAEEDYTRVELEVYGCELTEEATSCNDVDQGKTKSKSKSKSKGSSKDKDEFRVTVDGN